ncbi:MAG: hypothetical protein ACKVI4_15380, partial [Actinomycetales bacterium]
EHKGLLTKYTLHDARDGCDVHVPFWALARDYERPVELSAAACRGCAHGDCAHGWPSMDEFNPAWIIVLKLREDHEDCAVGWYVREKKCTRLIEVPRKMRCAIINSYARDPEMCHSSLLKYNAYSFGEVGGFHEEACKRFAEYRRRVRAAVKQGGKRKRCEEPNQHGELHTCVVCLDNRATARARCRGGTCTANVCDVCHSDSRGLCPICDRTAINATYPCGRCYKRKTLTHFGYECIGCGEHTLCRSCYSEYRECCSCESQ